MKRISHIILFGVLMLVLVTACTGNEAPESPTAGTTVPGDQTVTPFVVQTDTTAVATTATPQVAGTAGVDLTATFATATDVAGPAATNTTQTPVVPVTAADLTLLEGQFCIEGMAHALLVLPDTATFETVADAATLSTPGPDTGCNTLDRYSGRQIVICRGQQNTSLNLNICTDGNNCTQLLVQLEACSIAGTDQPGAGVTNPPGVEAATNTPGAGLATSTPAMGVTDTPPALIITVVTP